MKRLKEKIIFEDTRELARNINRTKFFVCAPQSLENTALTGHVSDVTARYYEAMACKTLIIGYKPPNVFDELFPYNAMIDLSECDFTSTIEHFCAYPEEYQTMVDKNYDYVMSHHTWTNRLNIILKKIEYDG